MVEKDNDLLGIAKADLRMAALALGTTNDEIMQNMAAYHTQQAIEKIIKNELVAARGYAGVEHDLNILVADAKASGVTVPEWVDQNSYEISRWATTIRYNSNFRTNRDAIVQYGALAAEWLEELEK